MPRTKIQDWLYVRFPSFLSLNNTALFCIEGWMSGSESLNFHDSVDIDSLPTLPAIAIEAMRLMEGEQSNFDSVAELLKNDQVLSTRLLHYANSAFIGARKVSSINQAVSVLGFNTVRSIILSATIFDCFSSHLKDKRQNLINFWLHSVGVAVTAETLAKRLAFPNQDEAYIAGLLHDIGKLVCFLVAPEKFDDVCQELSNQGTFSTKGSLPLDIEMSHLGTNHLEMGKMVAEKWQLPDSLSKVIWLHHQPVVETILPEETNLPQLIRFADVLCVTHNVGSSYFLTEGAYCHEHFHFALENLVLHHHFSTTEIDELVEEVLDKMGNLGNVLGFWDPETYQRLVSSANLSLGSMSINLDRDNKELNESNRVLAATCDLARKTSPKAPPREVAGIVLESARKAFNSQNCLCLVIDEENSSFIGRILDERGIHDVSVPVYLAEQQEYPRSRDVSAIEAEAVSKLQQTAAELSNGNELESCMVRMAAGSSFLATFFLADPKSRWTRRPILGELVVDMSNALDSQSSTQESLSKNFEAFALVAGNIIEKILLEAHLAKQTKKMTETSRKMEENQRQLFHSHRLATVGQLAAGAAHEINNPLTIISLNIQILERIISKLENNKEFRERLKTISGQEKRISKIIQELMGFARPAQPKFCPSHLNEILNKVLAVIGDRVSMSKVAISSSVPEDLPMIMVDPMQIEQVFMNLLINANHAMPEGGSISILATARKNLIEVSFKDSGVGISKENLTRIFDPFFTTKKEGEGTGLGLAICNSIVEHNGGMLRVESHEGKGSTFTVSLPIDKGSRLRALKMAIEQKKSSSPQKAPEKFRILVIDDEHLLNDMLQESLRAAGYEVDGAYDGVEGIGLLRYKRYDLILLDIRMPRKDGLEVLRFVKEEYPQIKVVIVTGLATHKEIQETVKMGAFACIKKPFRLEKVFEVVSKALEQ